MVRRNSTSSIEHAPAFSDGDHAPALPRLGQTPTSTAAVGHVFPTPKPVAGSSSHLDVQLPPQRGLIPDVGSPRGEDSPNAFSFPPTLPILSPPSHSSPPPLPVDAVMSPSHFSFPSTALASAAIKRVPPPMAFSMASFTEDETMEFLQQQQQHQLQAQYQQGSSYQHQPVGASTRQHLDDNNCEMEDYDDIPPVAAPFFQGRSLSVASMQVKKKDKNGPNKNDDDDGRTKDAGESLPLLSSP